MVSALKKNLWILSFHRMKLPRHKNCYDLASARLSNAILPLTSHTLTMIQPQWSHWGLYGYRHPFQTPLRILFVLSFVSHQVNYSSLFRPVLLILCVSSPRPLCIGLSEPAYLYSWCTQITQHSCTTALNEHSFMKFLLIIWYLLHTDYTTVNETDMIPPLITLI